ncbi:S-adenosyl-L-methionine-dependent methyltransferase [Phlyctochytrium arcticum]|nr:S-adenosyl-L-methionine-dependent methyltransferase [Phlyctochytrium arcticum]
MKPFISYVGSKSKIMKEINSKLPKVINRYFEPFVGGASVLFHIGTKYQNIEHFFINDKDKEIINLYKSVRDNCTELIHELEELNTYRDKESFLMFLDIFNNERKGMSLAARSALYIYLLKLSFNNNLKHDGDIIKPTYSKTNAKSNLYKLENIQEVSSFLNKVNILNMDYVTFLKSVSFKKGDFVFLDPPYDVASVKQYYMSTFKESDYKILLSV